ncbi:MAG: RsmE family RNA methyltransferase [Gaiellales bacterium]
MAHVFRFFLPPGGDATAGSAVTLAPDDAQRLRKVLRLAAGDPVEVADGTGRVFAGVVEDPATGAVRLEVELPAPPDLAPIRVLLAQSGPRADDAVEKLVELGVEAIAPLLAAGRRRDARIDRWQRIAAGAAAQAKLARIPAIGTPVAFAAALAPGAIVCSHEEPDADLGAALATVARPVTLLIGPEAGFSAEEHAAARAAGVPIASLGPTVLRTETAAIVAAALARAALVGA